MSTSTVGMGDLHIVMMSLASNPGSIAMGLLIAGRDMEPCFICTTPVSMFGPADTSMAACRVPLSQTTLHVQPLPTRPFLLPCPVELGSHQAADGLGRIKLPRGTSGTYVTCLSMKQ